MVLFFDGANYNSNNDPLHAFFSQLSELPPHLRYSTRNIITHSLWTGSTLITDFNLFLSRYNNELDRFLVNGILIEDLNIKINVKCHVFIADAPERAFVLNKFNGKFGCIMCVQEGENVNKGSRGNNFQYPYKPSEMFKRTEKLYAEQVHDCQTLQTTFFVRFLSVKTVKTRFGNA